MLGKTAVERPETGRSNSQLCVIPNFLLVRGQLPGDGVRSEMLTSLTQHALQTDPKWLASPLVVVRADVLFRAQTSRSP